MLALVASAPYVQAQEGEEAIHIDYAAPSNCPTGEAFFAQVRARSGRVRRAEAGARGRVFAVTITSTEQVSRGYLTIRDAAGGDAERVVSGNSCDEVVAALALITALAVDPSALTTPDVPEHAAKKASHPTTSAPSPVPPAAMSLSDPISKPSRLDDPAARRSRSWALMLMVNAGVVSAVSPGVLFGIPAYFEAAGPQRGLLANTVRAGFERASSGAIDVRGPKAHFTWTVGLVEDCPVRWTFGTLRVQPCARLEAGVVAAKGTDIVPARQDSRAWLALGAVARAQWFFVDPIFLDFEAGFRFPLLHARYFFQPDQNIYRTPVLGWLVSGGLGVRFL